MLGKPKYSIGEEVVFHLENRRGVDTSFIGKIYIIDAYGTFEDNTDVSYDILAKDADDGKDILFKHVSEKSVLYSITSYNK